MLDPKLLFQWALVTWGTALGVFLGISVALLNYWTRVQEEQTQHGLEPLLEGLVEKVRKAPVDASPLISQLQAKGLLIVDHSRTLLATQPCPADPDSLCQVIRGIVEATTAPSAEEFRRLIDANKLRITMSADYVGAIEAFQAWTTMLPFASACLLLVAFVAGVHAGNANPMPAPVAELMGIQLILSLTLSCSTLVILALFAAGLRGMSAFKELAWPRL